MKVDEAELIERLKSIRDRLARNGSLSDEDDMTFAVAIAAIESAAMQQHEASK